MEKFVFWTGIYNLIVGVGFFIPGMAEFLGIKQPESVFFAWSPALLVVYLGMLLILCSRNLSARGTLVYWEGILRVAGFFLLAGFGFIGDLGIMLGAMGIVDLLIGIGYLIGLPRVLNTTHADLLFDRVSA